MARKKGPYVPTKNSHGQAFKVWREIFLESLERTMSVRTAAKSAGVTRQNCYLKREADLEFAKRWDEIVSAQNELLEESAMHRAINGVERKIYFKDKPILDASGQQAKERVFETGLTIFLLKKRLPEKYADDWNNGAAGGGGVPPTEMAAEVRRALASTADLCGGLGNGGVAAPETPVASDPTGDVSAPDPTPTVEK